MSVDASVSVTSNFGNIAESALAGILRGETRAAERLLAAHGQEAAQVDDGEQDIPQFVGDGLLVLGREGPVELGHLLVELSTHAIDARPVEADPAGLLGDAMGPEQGGQGTGHPVQGGGAGVVPLLRLAGLPGGHAPLGGRCRG